MEYLVQQPASLERLAMDQLGQWIASQPSTLVSASTNSTERDAAASEHDLSTAIDVIRNYLLRYLPPKFHDKLATVLMPLLVEIEHGFSLDPHIDDYHSTVTGRFIEILFSEYISAISLDEDSDIFFPSIFFKTHALSGLTELKLIYYSSVDIVNITEADIVKMLQQLRKLRHLTLHYDRINNILRCLAENCELIEVLELAALKPVHENCYSYLSHMPNLRRLNLRIRGDNIELAGLLSSSEKLEHVVVTPSTSLVDVLSSMATDRQQNPKKLKIKSYIDGRGSLISMRKLQAIIEMCPHIQEISLVNYELEENVLMPLQYLQELRQLTLAKFEFRSDRVDELLEVRGRNIVHLCLKNVYQLDVDALLYVSKMCPNMESLSLEWCCFDIETRHDRPYSSFENLKKLSLEASYLKELGQSADEQLCFLVSMCPNVEYILFDEVLPMDEFWLKVLDTNPLAYLKELKFVRRNHNHGPPSSAVVDRIVRRSINCPEVLVYDSELASSGS